LFPNPSNGLINLNLEKDSNNINIYDIQGRLVWSEELLRGKNQINIKKAGFYYLEINELNFIPIIIK
jgi:hemin uptake protein HemP